ncbi:hypothetical protein [Salinifilum ghardaiensis]
MRLYVEGREPDRITYPRTGVTTFYFGKRLVQAHRTVVARAIGRPLEEGEQVYRRAGRKGSHELADLMLLSPADEGVQCVVRFEADGTPAYSTENTGPDPKVSNDNDELKPTEMARIYLVAKEQGMSVRDFLAQQFT